MDIMTHYSGSDAKIVLICKSLRLKYVWDAISEQPLASLEHLDPEAMTPSETQ